MDESNSFEHLLPGLQSLGNDIEIAFILLSAFNLNSEAYESDPTLIVIGNASEDKVEAALGGFAGEISIRVFTKEVAVEKFIGGNKFVRGMFTSKKSFLVGDDDTLASLYRNI